MTDSGTGSTTSRVGNGQPHSAATADGELRAEADVGTRPVTEPAAEVARPSPWHARLARGLPRPTAWIATIVVGSLLVPAITKQWSDRPRELEIKTTLVREISELTTDVVTARVAEIYSSTPTARLLREQEAALNRASKANKAEARKRYDAAFEAKVRETQTIYAQNYSTWKTKGAAIRAQLSAYFSGTQLARDWDALDTAMSSFIYLSLAECDRSGDVQNLRAYLVSDQASANIQWQLLEKSIYTDSGCYVGDANAPVFRSTYDYVSDRLILKQQQILDSVMKADMVGFSRGWHDLVKDVISGGS
jgi:hypothetical protein